MLPTATDYQVRISDVRFATSPVLGNYRARVRGFLKPHSAGSIHTFTLTANYDVKKRLWGIDLRTLRWTSPVARSLFDLRNVQSICKALLEGFRLLWIQPAPGPNEGGAQLRVGHTLMNEEQGRDAFSILRSDIPGLYRLDWPSLWPAIENRLAHDPEFWVSGFTRQDVSHAVTVLKSVFPWEWVRRRYRDTAKRPSEVGMWDVMQADQGFPLQIQLIFGRKLRKPTVAAGRCRTRIVHEGVIPSLHVYYKNTHLKQYPKEGRGLRTETTINNTYDFGVGRLLKNLPQLREIGLAANRRVLEVEKISHDCNIGADAFEQMQRPMEVEGQRASALRFGDARVQALLAAVDLFCLQPQGFTNKQLRPLLAQLLGLSESEMTQGRMSYDLRRLRLHGLRCGLTRSSWRASTSSATPPSASVKGMTAQFVVRT